MGVPGLYRWLVDRYPNTLCSVVEDASPYSSAPVTDASKPNPNGVEFDNLYIDMNGLIHPCFHPEHGLPAPHSYDDVIKTIFRYIERVFSIVRPRKLLFLSVDGVAPRAKMNHQRIRHFRTAREASGKVPAVEVEGINKLDPNVITPGTEFMALLSSALKYYVHWRMNVDPGWRHIKVILSDSSVAGEGEYKIMSYIRSQRNLPGYNPNTRHCLHGLEADLIMLALATHEIHFSILREVIINGQIGNGMRIGKKSYLGSMRQFLHNLNFEFFNIWVFREYLERELLPNCALSDFERFIDDFVFICLFLGNDFLPRLPSLDISEGGIELLLIVYREQFDRMGYLTNSSKVNLKSLEHFLRALSFHENAIFRKRCQVLMEKRKRKRGSQYSMSYVKVHNEYTKERYYTQNFDCTSHDVDKIKRDAVLKYTEGVCWIMHYYYQGLCSWQWFYPYHYAPFASDFCGLDKLEVHFTLGQPFKPLDQLLAVLPAASGQALPLFYKELMTKASSPILDFYPKDAKVDKNGKKHAWQGVCKLPFIEESRLLSETQKVEHTLTDEEKQRNMFGRDRLFVHCHHPLAKIIQNQPSSDPCSELEIKISPRTSGGMNGYLCISDEPVCPGKIHSPVDGKPIVEKNCVKSVTLKFPSQAHNSKLPCGVIMPPRILRSQDSPSPPVLWHATPAPSQSILSESPTNNSQKKKRKRDEIHRGCIELEMQDHHVGKTVSLAGELGMASEQHGSKDGVGGNYTSNEVVVGGKSKGKQEKKRVKGHKLEAEIHLVEGKDEVSGAGQNNIEVKVPEKAKNILESVTEEHEVKSELHLAEGTEKICGAVQDIVNVEVGEKPPTNGMESLLSSNNRQVVGGETQLSTSVAFDRENHRKRQVKCDKLGGGVVQFKVIGFGDKPPNKMEQEMIGGEVHLVDETKEEVQGDGRSMNGEKHTNKMESDLPLIVKMPGGLPAKGEEIRHASGEHKRKKHKKRKHLHEAEPNLVEEKVVDENSNGFEVGEKVRNKEQEIVDKKKRRVKKGDIEEKGESSNAKASESDLPKRKKHKSKNNIEIARDSSKVDGENEWGG